ncbi:MAG: DUF2064 domain-containing protein, partial [Salibacteraceae bacterium]
HQAAQDLNHQDWVLGPDARGGVYLIGIHRQQFEAGQFKNLSWSTHRLFAELSALAGSSVALLPQLQDLNSQADLLVWLQKGQLNDWLLWFRQLIFGAAIPAASAVRFALPVAGFPYLNGRRGPPRR